MDLLSRIGVASAHPGGFAATRRLLERELAESGLKVLEVGCGTGKSACHLAGSGFRVTALDRRPLMLEKARKRAEQEGISGIEWIQGDVQALPFEDESFDVVFAESVTIFTDIPVTFAEYHRVLKPNGRLLDRELVLHAPMPEPIYREITGFFKFDAVPTVDEWLGHLRRAGFRCERPPLEQFRSVEQSAESGEIRDLDLSMLFDPNVGQAILKYAELMLAQESYFRACDFVAYKTGSSDKSE